MSAVADQPIIESEGRSAVRWLSRWADDQRGRMFLWLPVALAAGVAIYFALPSEPPLAVVAAIAVAALVLGWLGRSMPLVVLVALVAGGLVLAKLRTEAIATPLLHATTGEVLVTGRVIAAEPSSRARLSLTIAPDAIEGIAAKDLPKRLRLSSLAKFGQPVAGTRIAVKARLSPLPTPVQPGGFDYGRHLYFESIGGTGRATAGFTVLDAKASPLAHIDSALTMLRQAIGTRIKAALGEPYASFAEALITGERGSIPKAVNQSLLVSGLFHILSISGLHMWLVAGGVFWTARAVLALAPMLALRYPIKKWSAALALVMGLFYMLLAEGGVATQRSFIMIAVVFFAVLVDRPAVSLRNLAIAALVILLLEPEAAIEASFQMSFLAVLGLAAFYEAWSLWKASRDGGERVERKWYARFALWLVGATAASLMTTVIAGSMSSIPALYHFGRVSPYGLLANALAIPVVGIIVMPAALVAVLLMPLGLEALPLWAMGEGLRLVMAISNAIAGLPGANMVAPQPPAIAVLLLGGGAVALALLRGRARALGVGLMMASAVGFAQSPAQPDLLVERTGLNAALRADDGVLVPALKNKARFTVEKWLQANGEEATPAIAFKRAGWTCAGTRCAAAVKGKRVVYLSGAESETVDCSDADIVIADFPLRGRCREASLRIDRFDLWKQGAAAVFISGEGLTVETARGGQGARPWVVVPQRRTTPFTPR